MVAQTELEQLLDVFNVSKYKTNDKHILEYTGVTTNPKVNRVVKYLNKAMQLDDIVELMKVEDEIDVILDEHKKETAEERRQKEEALLKLSQSEEKREEERRQKEEERRQKEEERHQKEAAFLQIESLQAQLDALMKDNK
jgi:ABC-type lipopolysaccharide export system ATPase subunit